MARMVLTAGSLWQTEPLLAFFCELAGPFRATSGRVVCWKQVVAASLK